MGGAEVMRVEPSQMGLVPYKRGFREILAPSTMGGHGEKATKSMNQEEGSHQTTNRLVS